jgi:hypothetical protein
MSGRVFDRRLVLAVLGALPVLPGLLTPAAVQAQTSQAQSALASWNDGPAKQAILEFVRATTDQSSKHFVPVEHRIATFDQDGTLWVEHPVYSQMLYCLDRVPALVAQKPALENVEPFKTVLSGNREAIAKLPIPALEKVIVATLTGMTTEDNAEVTKWLASAKDPRWKRPYTYLVYQPMLEVLTYLRVNRVQDFYRHRLWARLRACLLAAGLWHTARAGRRVGSCRQIRLRQER